MTLALRWTARLSVLSLFLVLAGCAAKPAVPSASADSFAVPADAHIAPEVSDRNAAALQQLQQSSESTVSAVRAIDIARNVSVNNIANAETTAFKSQRIVFEAAGRFHTQVDLTQGSLENTGQALDVGIQGPGYLEVKTQPPSGSGFIAYTRAGSLVVNSSGDLVVNIGDGYKLHPPITLPVNATNISIATDGTVLYMKAGATFKSNVGQIKLAMFPNPQGLNSLGGGIYSESEASGTPVIGVAGNAGAGQILSGFLEQSNVDLTSEKMRLQSLDEWRAALLRAVGVHD